MERDILSTRQMMVLLAVALLVPATDILPSAAARWVGRGGWLIALLVLPVLLLALWACSKVFCGDDLCARLGKPMGYTIIIIYLVWTLFVLSLVFRVSAARMEMIYAEAPPIFFGAGVAAVGIWMGRGRASALARAGEIFYLALTVVLAGVLVLALSRVEWSNLHPVAWKSLPRGSFSAAGILLNVAPVAILGARVPKRMRSVRKVLGWTSVFCGAVCLVLLVVLGSVGVRLCMRLDIPYLIMVQGLGIKGAFQRLEAPVAAMWLLSDLILAGMLLRAGNDYVVAVASERWGRWSVPVIALVALGVGWLLFPKGETLRAFCVDVLPMTGVVLGLVIPLLLTIVLRVRQKK